VTAARLLRQIHYWISLPLLVTVFVIAGTGSILALKKDFAALQPPTQTGSAPGKLHRPVADLIVAVSTVPGHGGIGWRDIDRIDIRPGEGVAKVILQSRTEVQVDVATGKVLQVGYRTSDFIETIHDFSILGGWPKYVLSFGSGLVLLAMAATGAYLFLLPFIARRRKQQAKLARNHEERAI
jgi:uncharacterized iron-regulated membrane protein